MAMCLNLISFLTSGAATIVGAKSEEEALSIYNTFTEELKPKVS